MIFDRTLLFSEAQAATASALSKDAVDLGTNGRVMFATADLNRDIGRSTSVAIAIQIVERFNNLTSLGILVQVSADAAFT